MSTRYYRKTDVVFPEGVPENAAQIIQVLSTNHLFVRYLNGSGTATWGPYVTPWIGTV